jgi:hypothetical protein
MLNPSLDPEFWITMAYGTAPLSPIFDQDDEDPFVQVKEFIKRQNKSKKELVAKKNTKMTKQKFLGLSEHLKNKVIGQDPSCR